MPHIRKTTDEYEVQQYFPQYGWEMVTTETTFAEARERRREYRENQPEYPVRIIKKCIPRPEKGDGLLG